MLRLVRNTPPACRFRGDWIGAVLRQHLAVCVNDFGLRGGAVEPEIITTERQDGAVMGGPIEQQPSSARCRRTSSFIRKSGDVQLWRRWSAHRAGSAEGAADGPENVWIVDVGGPPRPARRDRITPARTVNNSIAAPVGIHDTQSSGDCRGRSCKSLIDQQMIVRPIVG